MMFDTIHDVRYFGKDSVGLVKTDNIIHVKKKLVSTLDIRVMIWQNKYENGEINDIGINLVFLLIYLIVDLSFLSIASKRYIKKKLLNFDGHKYVDNVHLICKSTHEWRWSCEPS